jgi:phosphatidylserine/phosphatidylglycerophosphate/cardiolipin synthase-like enzyme
MKRLVLAGLALTATVGALAQNIGPSAPYQPTARVYFSPATSETDSPTLAVIREIDGAAKWVHVQAYSFTSAPILSALKRAHERGVEVFVLLDKSNATAKYSGAKYVINAGIPTGIDDKHAISHNKIMVIDGETVLTGSFNFTQAGEKSNAENLLVLKDAALALRYESNWQTHAAHSYKIGAAEVRSEGVTKRGN